MDEIARLRAHQKNIERYEGLLKTKLNEDEAMYLQKRLSEERLAMEAFRLMSSPDVPTAHELPNSQ